MRFQRLDIQNVRNLTSVSIELVSGLNFFSGVNGAGKTALLESLHLLCRGRSFRSPRIQPLITHGAKELIVRAQGVDEWRGQVTLGIRKNLQSRTELRVDGAPERRISEIARLTPLQVMMPDVADLVFGAPGERRRWLDWGTFHVKHDYLVTLREYLRVLKQRNALLRDGSSKVKLAPWTVQLVQLAQEVTLQRRDYLRLLLPYVQQTLGALAPGLEIDMEFACGWSETEGLEKVLGEFHARELKFGATQAGPHRADVLLGHRNAACASVLSRGQGKILASSMLIGQAALLAAMEKRRTVFLIDDLGAELDVAHSRRLLTLLHATGAQILATGTAPPPASLEIAALFSGRDVAVKKGESELVTTSVMEEPLAKPSDSKSTEGFRMFHVKHGVVQVDRADCPPGE